MIQLQSKTIKSKKDGKEYKLYWLEAGEFKTNKFFANSLTIDEFYKIASLVSGDITFEETK